MVANYFKEHSCIINRYISLALIEQSVFDQVSVNLVVNTNCGLDHANTPKGHYFGQG